MSNTYQTNLTDRTYNGWTNYQTWNVALWIGNDEGFYNLAQQCDDYQEFLQSLCGGCVQTPDGVKFADPRINRIELDSDLFDF